MKEEMNEPSFYIEVLKTTIAIFSEMPLIVVIIINIMMLLYIAVEVLEDWNYHKTFAGMPKFMWPTKQYWRENRNRYNKHDD
jgi:hypothetical protein